MTSTEFIQARKKLGKTQKQMAELLGASLKAVHSYEQGWRNIPTHVERQILFLVSRMKESTRVLQPCWEVKSCPPERKQQCPAWEFQSGTLCWFVNGTICEGVTHQDWEEKMKICHTCKVFMSSL
jgi:DNA-binding XRE family transcriptional regulator